MLLNSLKNDVVKLAEKASAAILKIYAESDVGITFKADRSPLTLADMASHQILEKGLKALTPDIPILSEESAEIPFSTRKNWQRLWVVDPLDGTKEFIQRSDEFSINIALVDNHQPVLGIIYLPVFKTVYVGIKGKGAYKGSEAISVASVADTIRVLASRSHPSGRLKDFVDKLPRYQIERHGSALKTCLIAEGKADVYPRFGPTSEWDTAAGQCILEAAGGLLFDAETKQPLQYNMRESLVNPNFVAVGDTHYPWARYLAGL